MHKIALNPSVVEKVVARRGRLHPYADFDPRRTALLVVDLQNAYMDKEVAPAFNQHAIDIVPNVNRIADELRKAGGMVVWIQNTATPESQASWSTMTKRLLSPKTSEERAAALWDGSRGHQLWPGLDVRPDDLRVKKTRFSAFIRGASDLEPQLRERGIENLIVTGTATGTCCESTARDGMMLNFAVIMVSDGNACMSDEEHNASLTSFYRNFGDVMATEEVVGFIRGNAAGARKAG